MNADGGVAAGCCIELAVTLFTLDVITNGMENPYYSSVVCSIFGIHAVD